MKGMQKIKRGTGFRGVLDYALTHEGQEPGELIGGNMSGTDARELAAEFGAVRQMRPDIERPVWHNSLRLPEGETLTPEKWAQIGDDYMQRMGFTDAHQRAYILHDDPAGQHLHIVANRIAADGAIYYGRNENLESTRQIQALERDHGLTITKGPEHDPEGRVAAPGMRRPTAAEINAVARRGEPSARMQWPELALAAQLNCRTYTEYSQRLDAVGVELVPVLQKGGAHMSGLSYRLDQVQIKGSDLGSRFTAAGIKKEGISYEQSRDGATARADAERGARRAAGITDAEIDGLENSERGRAGADDRAAGAGHRGADGREPADARADRPAQPSHRPADRAPAEGVDRGDQRGNRSSGRDSAGGQGDEPKNLGRGDLDRSCSGGAYERVISLAAASPAERREHQRQGGRGGAGASDRTAAAVARQVAALSAERYEVGIRDAGTGKMMNRTFTGEELAAALPWLKRQNAKGEDIYIRPAGDTGIVLVDDLKAQALEQMKARGFAPAAVVETSPGNFQAWIKFSDQPQPLEVRRAAAQALTREFGGDMNSADGAHYGRLAGFTNRKPKYERDGRSPYVLAHPSPGAVAPSGPTLARQIAEQIEQERNAQHKRERLEAIKSTTTAPGVVHYRATDAYRAEYAVLAKRYGDNMDASKADFMIAKSLAKRGHSARDIEEAIYTASPNIETRKAGHAEDYAQRTVAAAERTDEVRAARRGQDRDNDRGMSM